MRLNKLVYLAIAGSVLATSCSKELDQYSPDAISEGNAFTDIEHVQRTLNSVMGMYSTYVNDIYKTALVSDEAKIGPGNGGQGALTYRYQYSSDATTGGDVTAGYGSYYNLIDHVNRALQYVDVVPGLTSQTRRDEMRGQFLGMRGLAHFGVLQSFAKSYDASERLGIAIVTESNAMGRSPRNTMAESITSIEKDLADAKALLPAVSGTAAFSDTVLNRINIAAYQARIALWKKDYPAAITFANEVINSGIKPLVTGTDFTGIWTDAGSTTKYGINETLFRIRFATSSSLGALWTTAAGGLIYIAPSDKLVDLYDTDDVRKEAYIGVDGDGNNYVNKYYTSSRGGRVVDLKAIRIAEIYLIRAEAYARQATPNLTAAAADLNFLRSKRITGYVDETFSSATDLTNAILEERFKELCFEGQRFFDLKRLSLPVQRDASDASAEWQTLAASSYRFVFPIPHSAILANPNMEQNAGY